MELIAGRAAEKHLDIAYVYEGEVLAAILGDVTRLRQVLLNLLSNAIKYNRQDGQVAIACRTDGHGMVRIEVHDTGMGLDAQAQAKLFQAFERLQADKTLTEGTGIGLALSRRLMQVMNGDIGMSSELGVGSCFWVQLERADTERAAPAEGHTVLYIEDNPANVAFIKSFNHFGERPPMMCCQPSGV